jgi:hypothetical protein
MDPRPELGFASYNRFFSSQERMPSGDFGNLIALPLQRRARERGNSIHRQRAESTLGSVCLLRELLTTAAVTALEPFEYGLLAPMTALGKTVVGAKIIALRGCNTIVFVHHRQLLDQ